MPGHGVAGVDHGHIVPPRRSLGLYESRSNFFREKRSEPQEGARFFMVLKQIVKSVLTYGDDGRASSISRSREALTLEKSLIS